MLFFHSFRQAIIRLFFLLMGFSQASAIENPSILSLPGIGSCQLRILTPSTLELTLIQSKAPDPARVAKWDFITADGELQLPDPDQFQVTGKGKPIQVLRVGFKQRVLYAPLKERDLRIASHLYLQLSHPLKPFEKVEVQNPSGILWFPDNGFQAIFDPLRQTPTIHVNQVGYLPRGPKRAMVGYYLGSLGELDLFSETPKRGPRNRLQKDFQILEYPQGKVVFRGRLAPRPDEGFTFPSYQNVWEADFSAFKTPGEYRLVVPELGASFPFRIDEEIAMGFARTYALGLYHQRCGTSNSLPFTRFTHDPCHIAPAEAPTSDPSFDFTWQTIAQDSADYDQNPRHTAPQLKNLSSCLYPFVHQGKIDVSGGHHDAGDYSKYTINSAALIHALIFAVDAFPGVADLDNLGLPESGDGISDVLQEAKWESDFLAKMQDADGGFYFLVYPHDRKYESNVLPDQGDPQVVWPKNTSATAAAVAALAQTASSPRFKRQYPKEAAAYLKKAKLGWDFLMKAMAKYGKDGSYQKITHYGDLFMHDDELAWAACELFLATGDADYQEKLMDWFDPSNPDTRRWGWWRLWEAYGCATRSYAFAVQTGRLSSHQLNSNYLARCQAEIIAGAEIQIRRAKANAYGTSFSLEDKRSRNAGWYFSTDKAFDITVATLLVQPDSEEFSDFQDSILSNLNYEAGCNPANVMFLTGLGWKRQREIVHQYAQNDRRILPPSGIPIGNVQAGFSWLNLYQKELGALSFPSDGAKDSPFPLYDRWGDSFNVMTESSLANQGRSFGCVLWLAGQVSSSAQPWRPNAAGIRIIGTNSPGTMRAEIDAAGMDLHKAMVIWEAQNSQPIAGPVFEFPKETPPSWLEVEAQWPDGRRIFSVTNFSKSVPDMTPGDSN